MDLNEQAKIVHEANAKWWHDLETGERLERNKGELLMLCISEVAEAMEGERKNLPDDKLGHRPMAEVEMADVLIRLLDFAGGFGLDLYDIVWMDVPDNRGEALYEICCCLTFIGTRHSTFSADILRDIEVDTVSEAIGMICAYCEKFGYDLEGAYHEKLAYNRTRLDHQPEARKAAGGKKW